MHIRPRCCEWLPLATQQLRLRNLVRIQGLNIECCTKSSLIYYTLHYDQGEFHFYKSEALPSRQSQHKWAEIACSSILKSNLNCVCIKVWEQLVHEDILLNNVSAENSNHYHSTISLDSRSIESKSALIGDPVICPPCLVNSRTLLRPPDKLLFMWGVYFSGLIPISRQAELKCQPNSLIFQLNSEYFASPEHLTMDALREQLSISYCRFYTSIPKDSIVTADKFSINSPKVSRSSSAVSLVSDAKAEGGDKWNYDLLTMSKSRYIQLHRNCSEVKRSYDLQKLLDIQELQRLYKQKARGALDITTEIKRRCVCCITDEEVGQKVRTSSNATSMGRALSLLLSEQEQCNPQMLLRSQKLKQQIESLRAKQRLLQTEYEIFSGRVSVLRDHLATRVESHVHLQLSLHRRQQQLDEDKARLAQHQQCIEEQKECRRDVIQRVERRMSLLCLELRHVYPICMNGNGVYTICDIPFPRVDMYLNDVRGLSAQEYNFTPIALSASLGFIAHLVQMIAAVISRPLRNPIHHEGSRTRIVDVVKGPGNTSVEYPLYSRSVIPSKPVRYAIYLLNQNIAQLHYDATGNRGVLHHTIENIMHIISVLVGGVDTNISQSGPVSNQASTDTPAPDSVSKSQSSVDLYNVPVPKMSLPTLLPGSKPLPIIESNHPPQQSRICRSVGSYSDCEDDFKGIIDHCYSNSESNITNPHFMN